MVKDVVAINLDDSEYLNETLLNADIVTTSVGPKFVQGIYERIALLDNQKEQIFIAFENMYKASSNASSNIKSLNTKLKIIDHKTNKTINDWLPSISNIGKRPTVSGDDINIETHVIDSENHGVDINLYDKRIKVELLKFLRPEIKFSSLFELKKQIGIDTQKAKKFHSLK